MIAPVSQPDGKLLNELMIGLPTQAAVPPIMIHAVASDSRQVVSGTLFFALKGTRNHGIDFAMSAIKSGASVILYDTCDDYSSHRVALLQKQIKAFWLGIQSLDQRMGEIASRFYGEPGRSLSIIGITGTDGKTTVTCLLSQALMRLGYSVGSIGTLGYGVNHQWYPTAHTTPDAVTLQSYLYTFKQQACEFVVMEISSHALAQYRVNGCQIDIAVLTNLGHDHLDYHVDIAQYAAAKARLFSDFDLQARVLNLDDEFGRRLWSDYKDSSVISYSAMAVEAAAIRLTHRTVTRQGQDIQVETPLGDIYAHTHLIGDFNVDNTLACIAALVALGFKSTEINQAVADFRPVPGRMEQFFSHTLPTVILDFAHTEQALQACLLAARACAEGELWCVFGCGGERDRGKRASMGRIAEQLADQIIITDDNPRNESASQIVGDILQDIHDPDKAMVIHDRFSAIETALSRAGSDDLVVIAGKGDEQIQIIGCEHRPFSDRDVIQRIMQQGLSHD